MGSNGSHVDFGAALTGLRKLRDICYINSLLQFFNSVASLETFFISGAYRENINRSNRDGTRGSCFEVPALCLYFREVNIVRFPSIHSNQIRHS